MIRELEQRSIPLVLNDAKKTAYLVLGKISDIAISGGSYEFHQSYILLSFIPRTNYEELVSLDSCHQCKQVKSCCQENQTLQLNCRIQPVFDGRSELQYY